jgi:hypothetical protein
MILTKYQGQRIELIFLLGRFPQEITRDRTAVLSVASICRDSVAYTNKSSDIKQAN